MNWGFIGLVAVFGLFIFLLVANPRLSCFGKRIKSPFYPLFRKNRLRKKESYYRSKARQGGADGKKGRPRPSEDYGFKLD